MDDGFIFWPKYLHYNNFSICLNDLHPATKYTFEKAKAVVQNSESCQVKVFIDVTVILHPDRSIVKDIYHKDNNAHNYLLYDSAHPDKKDNVPYNIAKRNIVFASNEGKTEFRLNKLKNWLKVLNIPKMLLIELFIIQDYKFHHLLEQIEIIFRF